MICGRLVRAFPLQLFHGIVSVPPVPDVSSAVVCMCVEERESERERERERHTQCVSV